MQRVQHNFTNWFINKKNTFATLIAQTEACMFELNQINSFSIVLISLYLPVAFWKCLCQTLGIIYGFYYKIKESNLYKSFEIYIKCFNLLLYGYINCLKRILT